MMPSISEDELALNRLHELSLEMSGPFHLNLNLRSILNALVDLHGAPYGLLSIYNPQTGYLETAASVGLNSNALTKFARLRPTPHSSACGIAFTSKKRAVVEDIEKQPRFECYRDIGHDAAFRAVHSSPLLSRGGEIFGVISVYLETPRKPFPREIQLANICARQAADLIDMCHVREAFKDSEQRFRTMADNAPIMVWVTDPNGFCTFLSKTWFDFTGQTPETGLGFGWLQAIHPEDREDVEKIYRESPAKRKAFQFEYPLLHKDGEYRRVIDAVTPWFGLTGEFLGYIGSVMDISERIHLQQTVREIDKKLEARVIERTAKLEAQSNRLRTLADQLVTTEQRERKRIAAILHDHLQQILVAVTFQFAEASCNVKNREFEKIAEHLDRGKEFLSEAIRSARSLTAELRPPVLYEDGLTTAFEWLALKFKKDHDLEIFLNMDQTRVPLSDSLKIMIFESVKELLFNVVKHAKVKQASLTFKFLFNHVIYICVEDKGVGFKGSHEENILADKEGGLGLFSMRERLKILNAEFDVFSPVNEGTKIEIRIPIEPFVMQEDAPSELKDGARDIPVEANGAKNIKILLVDDHQIVREGIANLLKANPLFEVVAQADNGLDAIEKTARFLPDVIIMDINMPKLNGIEATRRIKKDFPRVKIIGLSVQDENDIADSMKKAGAVTLLNKTGDPEELIQAILDAVSPSEILLSPT